MSRKQLNTEITKAIGHTMRMLRTSRQWTLAEASERIGVSIPALSKMENGVIDFSICRLLQVAELFEVTPGYLLGESGGNLEQDFLTEVYQKDQQIIALQNRIIQLLAPNSIVS